MDAHKGAMSNLMKDRDIRALSLNINRLEHEQLVSQLRARSLSTKGSLTVQQNCLLRASILEDPTDQDVPWYPEDEYSETQTTEHSERVETSDEESQKTEKSKDKKGSKRRILPPVIVEEGIGASMKEEERRCEAENITTRTANFSTAATTSMTYTTVSTTASLFVQPAHSANAAGGRFGVEPSLRRYIQIAPELLRYVRNNNAWNLSTLGVQLLHASASPKMSARVQPSLTGRVSSSQPTPAVSLPQTTQAPLVMYDNSVPSISQRSPSRRNKTMLKSVHRALYKNRSSSSEEISEPKQSTMMEEESESVESETSEKGSQSRCKRIKKLMQHTTKPKNSEIESDNTGE